jgi:hypothetical protein
MDPDWFGQHGWHHAGFGDTLELLAVYAAVLLLAALVAGVLWWGRRQHAPSGYGSRGGAPLQTWPTASLASPGSRWGRPHWPADGVQLRASNADREQAVTLLREATAEGYLTLDEFEERLGRVYAARYLRDLDQLVNDIPGHPRPAALEPAHGAWRPVPARGHHAFGGGWIVFTLIILTFALHGWWLPFWPVALLVFLALRVGRHHHGHWGTRA